jgi:hypothetical protein
LPDLPNAREVGNLIAAIDALLVLGKQGEATRLDRERSGSIWDQAIEKIKDWQTLRRPGQLLLFGWDVEETPKSTAPRDEDHPLRDPWLDGEAS